MGKVCEMETTSLHESTRDMLLKERTVVLSRMEVLARDSLGFELESDGVPPSGYEREHAMAAMLENRLAEIGNALEKIDGGTYGICAGCKQAIPPRRLEVLPFATHCVKCQSEADKR